jgi:hypothetical protein
MNSSSTEINNILDQILGANRTFNLFCYGSNGLNQLSWRLNITIANMKPKAWGAKVKGKCRAFGGYSKKWKGSVATLINDPDGIVFGIIIEITKIGHTYTINGHPIDFVSMCVHEGVHNGAYLLTPISNVFRSMKTVEQKYVRCSDPTFAFLGNFANRTHEVSSAAPSQAYIEAIQCMLYDRRELMGDPRDEQNKPIIDIEPV